MVSGVRLDLSDDRPSMIGSMIVGLPLLLVGAIIYSLYRRARGGPLFDPGPRSIREFVEQRRTIIHPDD